MVVSEASCKYKRPIKLDDKLVCDVSATAVRPTSFDINYIFRNAETGIICAEGTTRMVLFNENSSRPMVIPEWFTKKYME